MCAPARRKRAGYGHGIAIAVECQKSKGSLHLHFWCYAQRLHQFKSREEIGTMLEKALPLCLPGTVDFWQAIVSGKKVWSDLRPNRSLTPLERFLFAETREVVSLQTRHRSVLS